MPSLCFHHIYVLHHQFPVHLATMKPYTDAATRAQALTLKAVGWTNAQIEATTGITGRTLTNILDRAIKAGFEPVTSEGLVGRLSSEYVSNAPKVGRPRKQEQFEEEVLAQARRNRHGREKTCAQIALELEGTVSAMTVWRILRKAGMKKKKKPTRKPGLTAEMRKQRL
jgi:transposase